MRFSIPDSIKDIYLYYYLGLWCVDSLHRFALALKVEPPGNIR